MLDTLLYSDRVRKDMATIPVEEKQEIERSNGMEEGEALAEDLKAIPSWKEQISFRGLLASLAIGIMYSVIVMKLNLTTGLVPTLNVSAALLAFVLLRSWTKLLHKAGVMSKPFTRQENTVVQTCAVACYSIAVGGLKFIQSDRSWI